MKRILIIAFAAMSLTAQPAFFAPPAPLTNTRYTTAPGGTFVASAQALVAGAAGSNATLVVWNEGTDVRAGARALDGAWSERLLASGARAVAAASDGREFAVITENAEGWSAALLDDSGAVLRQSSRVATFQATTAASNGSDYAVAGVDALGNVMVARVMRDGSVSTPAVIRAGAEDPVLASDGSAYLLMWQTQAQTIEAVRLDGTLQRLDAADILVFDTEAEDPAVAFNGTDYVAVWRGGPYVRGRRVRRDGTVVPEFVQISASETLPPRDLRLTRLGTRTGLTWFDGRAQVAVFDGWNMQTGEGFDTQVGAAPLLTALPNGGVALLRDDTLTGAPHYGSSRVLVSVAHAAPATLPAAPQVSAAQNGARLDVHWNAQPGLGYRTEVSLDGGPWLEYDAWVNGPLLSLNVPRTGRYAVRVRAFGDGGMSAYSEVVETNVTLRRRAVR